MLNQSSINKQQLKPFLLGLAVSLLVLVSFFAGALADRVFVVKPVSYLLGESVPAAQPAVQLSPHLSPLAQISGQAGITVADVAEQASLSVVTVAIKKQQAVVEPGDIFSQFGLFGFGLPETSQLQEVQRDIGTGFVVDGAGLVVTNRHVVADLQADYLVIDKNDQEYAVTKIYRDPSIDLAILKVEDLGLPTLPLGDSDNVRVGEPVIAIGTALGEFRHTVTTGVISGLGRGITAGDGFRSLESLEGVIQTDAAINPGNSGGPLLSGAGEVIGVNVATAQAENISFAIPINVIKASIENFNQTGQFDRPLLGVKYQVITEQAALFNEVPQGAYIVEVMIGSTAAEAGLQIGDIITNFDGQNLKDQDLAKLINEKKIGDKVKVKYWRADEIKEIEMELKGSGG